MGYFKELQLKLKEQAFVEINPEELMSALRATENSKHACKKTILSTYNIYHGSTNTALSK